MNWKSVLSIAGISVISAGITVWAMGKWQSNPLSGAYTQGQEIPANYASFVEGENNPMAGQVDFTAAASASTPAVVHIKTKIGARTVTTERPRSPFADLFGDDFFGDMFGGGGNRSMTIPEQRASGSGVIITRDGYIVTNNHVIENADEINVTLTNKKSYKAELVGTDPSSDLAVLKINAESLPHILMGNSDEVKLGQWVLAIGYPWSLDVTVTAGIVSAKARSLGLNRRASNNSPVESFIQTDAAVNQGNSGGALVDTEGKLIGINAAIASQTGSYAGYSYAIPVNIVKKITGDLVKYGAVQRAYLGVEYIPEDRADEYFKEQGITRGEGVYVVTVADGGSAEAAGLKKGDYVTAINNVKVNSGSEMVEQVANYKPGDKVTITYRRGNTEKTVNVTLKNRAGNFEIVKSDADGSGNSLKRRLGAEFENIDKKTAQQYGVEGGVKVTSITDGMLKSTRMQKDFVITHLNSTPVTSVDDLMKKLGAARGTVRLEGIYPGFEGVYGYPLNLSNQQRNPNNEN